LDMIFANEHAMCVDVRDKVFGVHSLVKDCCRKAVPVDYSKDPIQLCSNVLLHDFQHHRSRGFDFIRSTQRLQRILHGHLDVLESGHSDQGRQKRPRFETVFPRNSSTNDVAFLKLSGRVKGFIIWFGPISLYSGSTSFLEELKNQKWPYAPPNQALTDMLSSFFVVSWVIISLPGFPYPDCSMISSMITLLPTIHDIKNPERNPLPVNQ